MARVFRSREWKCEALFNTFVDGDRHKVFDGDTDLAYPLDLKRFLNYVGETVYAGIAYSSGQDGTARRSRARKTSP
jgi:hypothetical protein